MSKRWVVFELLRLSGTNLGKRGGIIMARAHLHEHNGEMLTVKQLVRLKYPIANEGTARILLKRMSVQEYLDYDIIAAEQAKSKKGKLAYEAKYGRGR